MDLLINILRGVFVCVALLMVLVILMQRPKSEGLGAAFGGGVTENIFGAQTTNVLTKFTGWLAGVFFLLTFALSILYAHKGNTKSNLSERVTQNEATASPTPSPNAAASADASATPSPGPSSTAGAVPSVSSSATPVSSPIASASPAGSPVPSVPARRKRR